MLLLLVFLTPVLSIYDPIYCNHILIKESFIIGNLKLLICAKHLFLLFLMWKTELNPIDFVIKPRKISSKQMGSSILITKKKMMMKWLDNELQQRTLWWELWLFNMHRKYKVLLDDFRCTQWDYFRGKNIEKCHCYLDLLGNDQMFTLPMIFCSSLLL